MTSREAGPNSLASPVLSVVVPVFNEQGNLDRLYDELEVQLDALDMAWEILFVDDGSSDQTWGVIETIHRSDERVKGLRLSRNFGHQYALFAGLHHARGRAVITMDGDLQHPPELIPKLVEKWSEGAKVVNTRRQDPEDFSLIKKTSSRLYYRLFSWLSGVPLEPGMADFRLLDRKVVNDILRIREEGLFLRGLVLWVGYPAVTVPFKCRNRHSGRTKYTLKKMLRFGWHGVSSFSIVPLRLAVLTGFFTSGISFAGILYAIYSKLIEGEAVPGWASTVAIISFLFGILFILLGVLGEYIGRILLEVRHRPRYLVSETAGVPSVVEEPAAPVESVSR